MNAGDLCDAFGVGKGTVSSKSKKIRNALGMFRLDPNWCLPSKMDKNPMAWLISVDGMLADARHMPRHLQEVAFEKGLIPYIPGSENSEQ